MNRPADLLVEQQAAGVLGDLVIEPEGEFPDPARAVVDADHPAEELLAAPGFRLNHLAGLEAQDDTVCASPTDHRGEREANRPLDARFDRTGEDFSIGEVRLPVRPDPAPPTDPELEIGVLGNHPQLALALEHRANTVESLAERRPRSHRVVSFEKRGAVHQLLELRK